jgi:PAS domain S-box-containing protein
LEQTVATLQQENIFDLAKDSVMTRTMEGIINFWNHSAEELYGWRQEEAIGKVSHNLLKTQFPKPLQEIESELVRNGRWEGKLVHTTRDGGRVVVESLWCLEPKGQPGAVVETNTRSTDCEMDAERRSGTYAVEVGKQEPLPASKLMKADDFLAKIANIVLSAGGILCLVVLSYFVYYYHWAGQRSFTSPVGALVYYVVPACLAGLLFVSLRLRMSYRVNMALCLCSVAFTIYAAEAMTTLWFSLPSVIEGQKHKTRIAAAKALGSKFDTRTRSEVIRDLRSQGMDAVPSFFSQGLLKGQNDGTTKSVISINGVEVLPLASIANKLTVVCNESGQFLTYQSDQHGFNNPQQVWQMPVEIVAVGDSYAQGYCVGPNSNFVSLIRQRHPGTVNLGIEGNGPLVMLATLKEYAKIVRPKMVLWFYFEGNDLGDLKKEKQSALLNRYLTESAFSQHLLTRQPEIDRALSDYLKLIEDKNAFSKKLEEISDAITQIHGLPGALKNIIKLGQIRQRLGLVYGTATETPLRTEPAEPQSEDRAEIDLLHEVLLQAKKLVSSGGGNLYFVYLPVWRRYSPDQQVNTGRYAVLQAVNKAGLSFIDIHPVFMAQRDPMALFVFPLPGSRHYNEEGHRLVAEEVLRSISSAN